MPYDKNPDDEDAIPEPIASRRDTQPGYRALTPTDAETIAKATRAGQLEAQREGNLRSLEMHFAEWFGADGDGGRLEGMERTLGEHGKQLGDHEGKITQLTEFKGRLMWLGGLAVTIGGAIAAIAFKIAEHLMK